MKLSFKASPNYRSSQSTSSIMRDLTLCLLAVTVFAAVWYFNAYGSAYTTTYGKAHTESYNGAAAYAAQQNARANVERHAAGQYEIRQQLNEGYVKQSAKFNREVDNLLDGTLVSPLEVRDVAVQVAYTIHDIIGDLIDNPDKEGNQSKNNKPYASSYQAFAFGFTPNFINVHTLAILTSSTFGMKSGLTFHATR